MPRDTLRVGVVGGGFASEALHLPALLAHESVEAIYLCDPNPARLRNLVERYGLAGGYMDYQDLIAVDGLSAIIVATPNALHYPVTMAALEAGQHVLCEKPLAMNAAQAGEMYERARESGLVQGTSFTYRFVPAVRRVKELIDEGYIGRPLLLNVQWYELIYVDPDMPLVWRLMKDHAGSGVLGDLARWWVGDFRRVCGTMQTYPPQRVHPEHGAMVPVEVDTSCAFLASRQNVTRAFVEAILTNSRVRPDFYDGVQAQAVVDAVARSMEQGGWVELDAGPDA